jgi:hypothetical protein
MDISAFPQKNARGLLVACNCIDRKEAELREAAGDPEVFIKDVIFDIGTKKRRFHTIAFYRPKILGLFRKTLAPIELRFDYCPLCGKKYVEEADNG